MERTARAVTRSLQIQEAPIDEAALSRARAISVEAGAVITFLGVVRAGEAGATITALEYESFDRMALHQFGVILDEVEQKWPIESVRLVHRKGVVAVNEPSLWVEVAAGHRGEAFAACQYLIDEMKKRVPIWKKAIPGLAFLGPVLFLVA